MIQSLTQSINFNKIFIFTFVNYVAINSMVSKALLIAFLFSFHNTYHVQISYQKLLH